MNQLVQDRREEALLFFKPDYDRNTLLVLRDASEAIAWLAQRFKDTYIDQIHLMKGDVWEANKTTYEHRALAMANCLEELWDLFNVDGPAEDIDRAVAAPAFALIEKVFAGRIIRRQNPADLEQQIQEAQRLIEEGGHGRETERYLSGFSAGLQSVVGIQREE